MLGRVLMTNPSPPGSLNKGNGMNQINKVYMYEAEKRREKPSERVKTLPQILGINEETCVYCNQSTEGQKTTDEIIPCSEGGRMNKMNCVFSCRKCNSSKGSNPIKLFVNKGGNKDRPIPTANRRKILNYVKRNKKYMKVPEDDRVMKILKDAEARFRNTYDDLESLKDKINRPHLPSHIQNIERVSVSPTPR